MYSNNCTYCGEPMNDEFMGSLDKLINSKFSKYITSKEQFCCERCRTNYEKAKESIYSNIDMSTD